MSFLVVFMLAVLILIAALSNTKKSAPDFDRNDKPDGFPYRKNNSLFSPAERSFLGVLEQAIGSDLRAFGKVRIADVVSVSDISNRSLWQRAFNRISAKHFDFIICNVTDLAIVCAIELDDKSHQQGKRQDRDDFVSGVCQAVSLPFLQIPAQQAYSLQELRSKILLAIEPSVGA